MGPGRDANGFHHSQMNSDGKTVQLSYHGAVRLKVDFRALVNAGFFDGDAPNTQRLG